MSVFNILVPLVAVLFNFVVQVLSKWRQKGVNWLETVQQNVARGAIYVASIGMLEVLARYEHPLAHWAQVAMGAITATEILAGLAAAKVEIAAPPVDKLEK